MDMVNISMLFIIILQIFWKFAKKGIKVNEVHYHQMVGRGGLWNPGPILTANLGPVLTPILTPDPIKDKRKRAFVFCTLCCSTVMYS